MPTVSVVIPSYNRALFLKEAIDSVLAQGFEDFEVIVVDDGSTDTTNALLASCPRVFVVTQDRLGVSAARNAGIARAAGRFLAFLDSDDLWLPEKLAAQIAFFERHPQALICQTEEIWIRDGVRVNPKMRHSKPSGMIFERSLELCLVSPSAVMMRRDLIDKVGWFDETLPACEDYDLWLRIACRFPIYLIDTPLIIKRGGHQDQLSRQPGLDRYRIYALVKILESPPKGGLTAVQRKAAVQTLSNKCAIYSRGCLKRGRVHEAHKYATLPARFHDRDPLAPPVANETPSRQPLR
ncbi:MAG: glycosyltransferase, partial [Thermodesulfobacteriota bacterium]|nr:glycosyltransferase [Thermodesulfobacteriota bacterium]